MSNKASSEHAQLAMSGPGEFFNYMDSLCFEAGTDDSIKSQLIGRSEGSSKPRIL
jgi:hypothetical protein